MCWSAVTSSGLLLLLSLALRLSSKCQHFSGSHTIYLHLTCVKCRYGVTPTNPGAGYTQISQYITCWYVWGLRSHYSNLPVYIYIYMLGFCRNYTSLSVVLGGMKPYSTLYVDMCAWKAYSLQKKKKNTGLCRLDVTGRETSGEDFSRDYQLRESNCWPCKLVIKAGHSINTLFEIYFIRNLKLVK